MRVAPVFGSQFAQVSLSMTEGHSSQTTARAGRGDAIVKDMRPTRLRRILLTTLHIAVPRQRRSRSLQSGIWWVGLSRRALRAPAAAATH